MIALTAAQIAEAVSGTLSATLDPATVLVHVTPDSREVTAEGTLYVAKPGERADGHDFIDTALGAGAQRGVDEVVAVGALPRLRHVERALGGDLPRVGGDVHQHGGGVEGGRERAGHGLGDLGCGESDHDSMTLPSRTGPETEAEATAAPAARASRRATRSSSGTSSPS